MDRTVPAGAALLLDFIRKTEVGREAGMTRVTIALTDPLKEELDLYAAEHSRLYEPVETAALIPHMLESFLRSDRGWRSRKAKAGKSECVP